VVVVTLFGLTLGVPAGAQVGQTTGPVTAQVGQTTGPATGTTTVQPRPRDLSGMIARSAPSSRFETARPPIEFTQLLPGQTPVPAIDPIPRVIPLEPPQGPGSAAAGPAQPRIILFPTDQTGLRPERPPLLGRSRSHEEVAKDVANLVEVVKDPEAEISLVEGQTKILQLRRAVSRIVIANPNIADVEIFTDQQPPGQLTAGRLLNLSGRAFGITTLTIWDDTNRPVSFLVRVSLDTKDLESRIRQSFPGAEIKVRQAGPQIILDGQSPDSKTLSDILQLVTMTLTSNLSYQAVLRGGVSTTGTMGMGGAGAGGGGMGGGGGGMGGGGMGGAGGGMGGGMGMAGGAMGGMGAGGAGGVRGLVIINRVTVPGPRQILLHVKIAEINRSATRSIGVSWAYARGKSIIGSAPAGVLSGGSATMDLAANSAISQTTGGAGFAKAGQSTVGATNTAAPTSNTPLFGVFDSGHFSLFIDALRINALAKILAEPNLVALEGQPARFLVGGLFPFPVPQSSSIPGGTAVVTVQFQRFGTILTFLPEILPNDVIRLDVEPVISSLNFAQGTTVAGGNVPSIDERSARTVVEMREGQTLAIAGLLQLTTNGTATRIPGLGDLPIVGPWFSGITIETIETETVVLVTPELVSPLDKKDVTEAPGDRVYQPNDVEFYFLGRLEGKLGREFRSTTSVQDPLNLMKHFQSEQQWLIGPHGHSD
jgi:pilus assembly protein CpaC